MYNYPTVGSNRRRIRPNKLRLLRGSSLHHDQRDRFTVYANEETAYGTSNQGEHSATDNILHHLRLPGDIPLLRQHRRSQCRDGVHLVRHSCILRDDSVAVEARMAAAQLQ